MLNVSRVGVWWVWAVVGSTMVGGMRSGMNPPGVRDVSHPHIVVARTVVPQKSCFARCCRIYAPGLLPGAGRHQVVDDVRRDENQQITSLFRLGGETEQLSQDRQIYKERDPGLRDRDLGHRKPANYSRFSVAHEHLVVRLC